MARYCPAKNNDFPFNQDPMPEEFTLKHLTEHYLDSMPVGLSEITEEGPVHMVREAYSWRTDVPRVFVARNVDGARCALVEINGSSLEEAQLTRYLEVFAAYVTGASVRALGRLGAVVLDIMLRNYYPDSANHQPNLMGWKHSMPEGNVLRFKPNAGGAVHHGPVMKGVRRVEYTSSLFGQNEIFEAAVTHLGDWPIWETIARTFPRTIVAGDVPLGVACFRPTDSVSLKNGGAWVPVSRANASFSRTDIVCVTTPQGHAVLMCLDTQNGIANCEPGEEYLQPAMQWLLDVLPDDLIATHANNPCGLLYGHLGAKLINDNLGVRGRRASHGVAGASDDYPRITHKDGSFYPMVLDAVFVPPEASIHDILSGNLLGIGATPA